MVGGPIIKAKKDEGRAAQKLAVNPIDQVKAICRMSGDTKPLLDAVIVGCPLYKKMKNDKVITHKHPNVLKIGSRSYLPDIGQSTAKS